MLTGCSPRTFEVINVNLFIFCFYPKFLLDGSVFVARTF